MDIGAWGDSITHGAGDADGLGWVGRLRKQLYESERDVYNRGVCGDTTSDVLERFEVEVASIQPETIVLAVGINDSKFPNNGSEHKVPPGAFKENVRQLIGKAQSVAKKVVVIGLTEVNEGKIDSTSLFTNAAIKEYDGYVREAALGAGVDFVSMQGVLNIETDLEDGLHPNSAGYEKMLEVIAPFVLTEKTASVQ